MPTLNIAHRGASADAPENTLRAFALALDQGADMLEFDVRPTADGEIVVFHDDTTARWNGRDDPVDRLTLAQLRQLDIGGERVPTLQELFDWARTTPLRLNVEIKQAGIEAEVAHLIHQHDLLDRVVVSCFDFSVLESLRSVDPSIPRGALMGTTSYAPGVRLREAWPLRTLRRLDAAAWHPAWQLPLLDHLIPRVRAAGYAVNVWTVDDPAQMLRFLALGVEGIMTNYPARLRAIMTHAAHESPPA
jgi:glycerophosphoryl diester phosphodiesterase